MNSSSNGSEDSEFPSSNNSRPLIKCLTECSMGSELKVVSVNSGRRAKQRLANLGIVPGTIIVKQQQAPFRGPISIEVKGTSLVIGRGLAAKIYVDCNQSCQLS